MTSDTSRNALSRYAEAHRQLTDLDAERDCLAVLARRARARFVHAEVTDRQRLKLEHGALQRAVDLFMDEYDRPTRSSLKATIQAALSELGADGPSTREKARHLNGLREPLFSPPIRTFAEINASLRASIERIEDRQRASRSMEDEATSELEAIPDLQGPPDQPANTLDVAATMTVPVDPDRPDVSNSQPGLTDPSAQSLEEIAARLETMARRPAEDGAQGSRWFGLQRIFRL